MTTYFTSDTHFSHKNILHLGDGRPFTDINHHNEMIIRNWNNVVQPDDTVYHLGDVALGPWPEGLNCVKRLNGHKVLIPGNHDRISSIMNPTRRMNSLNDYEDAFQEIWGEVEPIFVNGHSVQISHYPIHEVLYGGRRDRYNNLRPKDDGRIIIHGHTHVNQAISRTEKGTLQIHVGVDSWNWTPVSENQVIDLIEQNT